MSVNSIKASMSVMQSTQTMTDTSEIVSKNMMDVRIIGLIQGFCSLLIIVGLIVGIIYMIKSKKTRWKKNLIGTIIIVVPVILNLILYIVKFNMLLNI